MDVNTVIHYELNRREAVVVQPGIYIRDNHWDWTPVEAYDCELTAGLRRDCGHLRPGFFGLIQDLMLAGF